VAVVLTALLRGDLVVRSLYDDQVRRADTSDTQADRNTEAVARMTGVIERLTAVIEERDKTIVSALDEVRRNTAPTGGRGGG
jgi:hypothetical protein